MSGARSSHWPWNAFAPPMPTGPTMSGPLPDAISVDSASFAPAYGTASNVTWMFGWLALNASTTCFSTSTWSGASPPPRQQYHRISVTPAAADAGADADRQHPQRGEGSDRSHVLLLPGSDDRRLRRSVARDGPEAWCAGARCRSPGLRARADHD